MSFIFNLVLAVIIWCVQVVLFIVKLVITIVMSIGFAIVFIPVLLFNLWNDSRDDDAKF
jgi:hypothetical protein